jgi:hypothetical protein
MQTSNSYGFLHVADVHILILLVVHGNILFWPSSTSIRTVKEHDLYSLDFFGLLEEIENGNMMRADKVMQLLCWSSQCDSEWSLGRYAIHWNHEVAACAGTQKQHLSGRWLLRADVPFEGKNDNFDPVSTSKERYGVQLNVEKFPCKLYVWILRLWSRTKTTKVLEPSQSPLFRGYWLVPKRKWT